MVNINKNIIYDKFLIIEGFAYRGKLMVEHGDSIKAIQCYDRIKKEMGELEVLLKKVPNGFDAST